MRKSWILGLAGLLLVVALPVVGRWLRAKPEGRCRLDGVEIIPAFRVRIVDDRGHDQVFCCIRCAQMWLDNRKERPTAVYVTDESSGEEIAASSAFFVRSSVITMKTTGDRVHVFRSQADAEAHAVAHGGRLLSDAEKPFSGGDRNISQAE